LIISFCLGKIIHAMANRPAELAMDRAREHAGRVSADSALKWTKKMTPYEQDQFSKGNTMYWRCAEARAGEGTPEAEQAYEKTLGSRSKE